MNENLTELIKSTSIFVAFIDWLEAMDKEGAFDTPIETHTVVNRSFNFGGDSITLDISHFRRLRNAVFAYARDENWGKDV